MLTHVVESDARQAGGPDGVRRRVWTLLAALLAA